MTPEFLLTTLIVVAMPGAGVLYTLAAGVSRLAGQHRGGGRLHSGNRSAHDRGGHRTAAIMHASAVAFSIIKWLGVATCCTWREDVRIGVDGESVAWRVIGSGILVNPKLTIFFLAFLPQFVPADSAGAVPLMVYLSAVFMAVTLVVFSLYGVFAAAVRTKVFSRPRIVAWARRSFGATYLVLAGKLAAQTR